MLNINIWGIILVKTIFDFKPKSGPAVLMTGGILFVLVGSLSKIGGLTFLGILMIIGGALLSYHWSQIIRGRFR